jgi:hypothetical protein
MGLFPSPSSLSESLLHHAAEPTACVRGRSSTTDHDVISASPPPSAHLFPLFFFFFLSLLLFFARDYV